MKVYIVTFSKDYSIGIEENCAVFLSRVKAEDYIKAFECYGDTSCYEIEEHIVE